MCIEEHSVFRKAQMVSKDTEPAFMICVVGHKVAEEFHHWYAHQDDLGYFYQWLEPYYRGVLEHFVKMYFTWEVRRPNNH